MAEERCNERVHAENPNILFYDWEYYKQLLPLVTGDVLDVGCGGCMFLREYIKKPEVTSVFGIDKYTDEIFLDEKATYMNGNIPQYFPDHKVFDTIVSTEFLEHIERDQLEPLLEKITKVMDMNSIFIGSTPNKIGPTTNPFHLYEYTLPELAGILKNYFTDVEIWDNGQWCTIFKCKL